MDQRTCIKFCVKNEIKCADAFRMLTVAYGEATLDRSNVYRWYKMFSEGREDVNDGERAGRPSTSTTDEKINEVEKMILANRRITVREVAEDLNISIGSCYSIFINDLGMRRVAAKFVPKLLNCDQKQHRMNIPNEMLDSVRDDSNLLQRLITDDEAGVVHHEFLPQGRTINKEYYLQVMRNLREAIRQKRSDLWKNKNWPLHHDNAPAHTSLLVRDFLAKNNTLMMPQPPYSPDLASCVLFFDSLGISMRAVFEKFKSWKMAISEPKSAHLREVLLFAFNWKKGASKAHRMLEEVYSDHALSKSQCYRWFKKFQSGDFEHDNEPHGKPPQKFEDAELQALLDEESTQMRSNSQNSSRHEKKSFLHRIVTSDEKWIHFSNPTRQRSWGLPGQFPKQTPRPNRFGKKAMLCIWWDQTGVVYFELLKPGKMVNTSRYEQQMHSLREALNEKRPEWREKHNNLILQHDNAPAHNATVVKNTIKDLA
ncbi:hypothetical protein LAZ67_X003927 [Cordylochernes scorpioides]|uniref:Mos1 transposase HTH domain-containing protein n=1 Tax=Cordylochernes scorpioides TaxID=51811 RepID=A0ABY6LX48_9ARAC|nr:hypothetical protein LAZ67_X003927 [Cordylochernes scorpioides]